MVDQYFLISSIFYPFFFLPRSWVMAGLQLIPGNHLLMVHSSYSDLMLWRCKGHNISLTPPKSPYFSSSFCRIKMMGIIVLIEGGNSIEWGGMSKRSGREFKLMTPHCACNPSWRHGCLRWSFFALQIEQRSISVKVRLLICFVIFAAMLLS